VATLQEKILILKVLPLFQPYLCYRKTNATRNSLVSIVLKFFCVAKPLKKVAVAVMGLKK
jgi:hypothetical protein